MERIESWSRFCEVVGSFAGAARPLDAMRDAGVQLAGPLAHAFSAGTAHAAVNPSVLERLKQAFGEPPPTRMHIGRSPLSVRSRPGNFGATASLDLAIANQVIAELWRVRTLPRQLSQADTDLIFTLEDLRRLCTGVPNGPEAKLGRLQIAAPPVLGPGSDRLHLGVTVAVRLPVEGPRPAALAGVIRGEVLLQLGVEFDPDRSQQRIVLTTGAATEAAASFEVDPASAIRPRSSAARAELSAKFQTALRALLTLNRFQLSVPGEITPPDPFSRTTIRATQPAAVVRRAASASVLTAGLNLTDAGNTDPAALETEQAPAAPANIRIAIDEKLVNDAIAALIASGDLERFVNDQVKDAIKPLSLAHIDVTNGGVTFRDGSIAVSFDCEMRNACAFGKDLGFTMSVTGRPQVFEGSLTLDDPVSDVNLDNSDAVVCTILGGLLGPLSLLIHGIGLGLLASFNPTIPSANLPVAAEPGPLPGSEQRIRLELLQAITSDGSLLANGTAGLVLDTTHTFVYVRVMAGLRPPAASEPLVGAKVQLFELDNPAPAGDDTVVPAVGESERILKRIIISESRSYDPLPDALLGVAVTDETGLARFAVSPTRIAGLFSKTETREDVFTGKVLSTHTERHAVGGDRPDLAVTIVAGDGSVRATKLLVALNLEGNHLGTLENPVVVQVDGTGVIGTAATLEAGASVD